MVLWQRTKRAYEFAFTPEGWFFNVPGAKCNLIWEEQPQEQPQEPTLPSPQKQKPPNSSPSKPT